MKELLKKYKVHVLVAVVAVVGLLLWNGGLKGCDAQPVEGAAAAATDTPTTQPASTTPEVPSEPTVTNTPSVIDNTSSTPEAFKSNTPSVSSETTTEASTNQ